MEANAAWREVGVMTVITLLLVPLVAREGADSWLLAGGFTAVSAAFFGPVAWWIRSRASTDRRGELLAQGIPLVAVFLVGLGTLVVARPRYEFELGALLLGATLSVTVVMLVELLAVPAERRLLTA